MKIKITNMTERPDGFYTVSGEADCFDNEGNKNGKVYFEAPKAKVGDNEIMLFNAGESCEPSEEEKKQKQRDKQHEELYSKKLPKWKRKKRW